MAKIIQDMGMLQSYQFLAIWKLAVRYSTVAYSSLYGSLGAPSQGALARQFQAIGGANVFSID